MEVAQTGKHNGHASDDIAMGPADAPSSSLELSQLPVDVLLGVLSSRPEAELREAASSFIAIGAKLGSKVVAVRDSGAQKTGVRTARRSACNQCRRAHDKCDGQKPCARCVSKDAGADCSYTAGEDVGVRPQSTGTPQRERKKPPVQKPGYTSSGSKLCEHGMDKRYCLHPTCVSRGSGKGMCKHGKRKRSCVEPECIQATQERRRQIQSGRCRHGVQMRTCTAEECRVHFQLAGHQYREKLKERKHGRPLEPVDALGVKIPRRGRPPLSAAAPAPSSAIAGRSAVDHVRQDGEDREEAAAAAVMALVGQDMECTVPSVSLEPHGIRPCELPPPGSSEPLALSTTALASARDETTIASIGAPRLVTFDDVRRPEHAVPSDDVRASDAAGSLGEPQVHDDLGAALLHAGARVDCLDQHKNPLHEESTGHHTLPDAEPPMHVPPHEHVQDLAVHVPQNAPAELQPLGVDGGHSLVEVEGERAEGMMLQEDHHPAPPELDAPARGGAHLLPGY